MSTTDSKQQVQEKHVFLSYSRANLEFARYLRSLFEQQGQLNVWMDEKRLLTGDNWWKSIERSIDTCSAFVIIMSPASDESRYVHAEILRAFDQNKPIFPILLEGQVFSLLASVQYEDMREGLTSKLSTSFLSRIQEMCGIVPRDSTTSTNPIHNIKKSHSFALKVVRDDLITYDCDVVMLKYAMQFLGADQIVAHKIRKVPMVFSRKRIDNPKEKSSKETTEGLSLKQELLASSLKIGLQNGDPLNEPHLLDTIGNYTLIEAGSALTAQKVLFVSTCSLQDLTYSSVRELSKRWLEALSQTDESEKIRHVSMTLHGVNFGLDIGAVLEAQITGLIDAARAGTVPKNLETISLIEHFPTRFNQIVDCMEPCFQDLDCIVKQEKDKNSSQEKTWIITVEEGGNVENPPEGSADEVTRILCSKAKRAYALTIMSDDPSFEDCFYYGIQRPVHGIGLLCERTMIPKTSDHDETHESVKELEGRLEHIAGASVIICDASKPNDELCFLIGYAHGRGLPMVLLNPNKDTTTNNTNNRNTLHLCRNLITYDKIFQLEEKLRQWLQVEVEEKQKQMDRVGDGSAEATRDAFYKVAS